MTADVKVPNPGPREWVGLAVLALPTLLLSLDFSILYLALPHLAADLAPSGTQQLWIMDIFGFMIAGFLVTMGSLGDRIGRRRILVIGGTAFGIASILAAYSTSPEMLIVTRALMGIAGASLMPSTLALISTMFQASKHFGFAISLWMACFMGGLALGPVVGGLLLEQFWWGSVFLLGVPVMVLLLALGPFLLPEAKDPDAGAIDITSVILSLIAILTVVYSLKEIVNGIDMRGVLLLAVGLAAGCVFVRRQLRLDSPLLDVCLFRNGTFSAVLGVWLVSGAVQGGSAFLIAQHLQSGLSLSALEAGLHLVAPSLAMIVAILLAPMMAQRLGNAPVMGGGMLIAAGGYLLISVSAPDQLASVLTGYGIGLFGLGLPSGIIPALVLQAAPKEKAGSASSVQETVSEFGIAFGVAVFGSIAAVAYRAGLSDRTTDAPEQALDSIAGATEYADTGTADGSALLAAAQEAFGEGFTTTAAVASATFAVLATVSFLWMRTIDRKAHVTEDQAQEDSEPDRSQTSGPPE